MTALRDILWLPALLAFGIGWWFSLRWLQRQNRSER